jgi:WD40 repeat protein
MMQTERQMKNGMTMARMSRRDMLRGLAAGALALGAAGCAIPGFGSTATPVPSSGSSLLIYTGHTAAVNGVAWSPDGKRIASASSDHTVNVWSATTGETLLTYKGHLKEVWDVGWAPDATRIVTGSADNTARVCDGNTAKPLQT